MDLSHLAPPARDSSSDDTLIAPIAWTPEQQIARMLLLCEAQMESALSESDVAVDELIKSFKGLIEASALSMRPPAKPRIWPSNSTRCASKRRRPSSPSSSTTS